MIFAQNPYVYFLIRETRGWTLEQIDEMCKAHVRPAYLGRSSRRERKKEKQRESFQNRLRFCLVPLGVAHTLATIDSKGRSFVGKKWTEMSRQGGGETNFRLLHLTSPR
jgi:hypothetical protein